MVLEENLINGAIALLALVISAYFYLWREKRIYLEKKKIEAYATYISALEDYWRVTGKNIELEDKMKYKLYAATSAIFFYGSDDVYRNLLRVFELHPDGGSRLHRKKINELYIQMLKEIDEKRMLTKDEIWVIED